VSEIADKLREARALIERGWTKGEFALDANGDEADGITAQPVCFCALGAISQAAIGYPNPDADDLPVINEPFDEVATFFAGSLGFRFSHEVARWNDALGRTQAEVLAAFDKAIELAEQSA
jgi:hypothetical protein